MALGDLVRDIRNCGVTPGSILALHSSMKSIGLVDGGPNSVIDAFLQVLGPGGTLMVPTFTYGPTHEGRPFDPHSSASVTGLLTETMRNRPDAVRSFAPVHSIAAAGAKAAQLTRDHLATTTLGRYSPFHRLAEWGGFVMLLGCLHTSNSTIHVAESLAEVPFLYRSFPEGSDRTRAVCQPDGRVKRIELTEFTGCSKGYGKAEPFLRDAGVVRDGRIGAAPAQLMKAADILRILVPLLKVEPGRFLCDTPTCSHCVPRREFLAGR